jgi:hypothetical protein
MSVKGSPAIILKNVGVFCSETKELDNMNPTYLALDKINTLSSFLFNCSINIYSITTSSYIQLIIFSLPNSLDIANIANIANVTNISNIATIAYITNIANVANIANITNLANITKNTNIANMATAKEQAEAQLTKACS